MALTDTSFQELNLDELKAAAKSFAVNLNGKTKKAEIISEIEANGVTWPMYVAMFHAPEDDLPAQEDLHEFEEFDTVTEEVVIEEPVIVEETVVVETPAEPDLFVLKMIRKNFTYQIRGYTFTREHPYALVKEEDADYLIEVDGGFRMASPSEVKSFYGV